MSRRPTIADLAAAAGVSVATVDRVLNKRLPVREETARRVLAAAEAIGFHAAGLIKQRLKPDAPPRSFAFLLQKQTHPFYRQLGHELAEATRLAPSIRGRAIVEYMEDLAPATIVGKLLEVGAKADAVALVSVDHPNVSEAIERLRGKGVPTLTLLTDLSAPSRTGYVGLDNRKAGRAAAWMIAHAARRTGKVALLVGSHRFLGHELREIGFRSYFREHAPDFAVLDTLVNLEDPNLAYEATLDLLKRHSDLAGLCVAGGGMEGVIGALREERMHDRLAVVCNELTPDTRAALIDQIVTLVIATPVPLLAARTVEAMVQALDVASPEAANPLFLPFDLFISENI